jgi:hypothetical protein
MEAAELDARYQRDAAALIQARGIGMNKSLLVLFFVCVVGALVSAIVVAVSGAPGWALVATVGTLGGVGAWSGKMDTLMLAAIAGLALLSGVLSAVVAVLVIAGAH